VCIDSIQGCDSEFHRDVLFSWHDVHDVQNEAGFSNIPGNDMYGAGKSNEGSETVECQVSEDIFWLQVPALLRGRTRDVSKGGFLQGWGADLGSSNSTLHIPFQTERSPEDRAVCIV